MICHILHNITKITKYSYICSTWFLTLPVINKSRFVAVGINSHFKTKEVLYILYWFLLFVMLFVSKASDYIKVYV